MSLPATLGLAFVGFVSSSLAEPVDIGQLRADLLTRAGVDQALRMDLDHSTSAPDPVKWRRIRIVDAANTRWMHEVVAKYGWPTRSMVGDDAAQAAWLLVQHADADRAFQRRCLTLIEPLGQDEVSGEAKALLTDRVLLADHRPQRYGSQLTGDCTSGYTMLPVEDEAHVDQRRASVGLPPIAEYRTFMNTNFCGGAVVPPPAPSP